MALLSSELRSQLCRRAGVQDPRDSGRVKTTARHRQGAVRQGKLWSHHPLWPGLKLSWWRLTTLPEDGGSWSPPEAVPRSQAQVRGLKVCTEQGCTSIHCLNTQHLGAPGQEPGICTVLSYSWNESSEHPASPPSAQRMEGKAAWASPGPSFAQQAGQAGPRAVDASRTSSRVLWQTAQGRLHLLEGCSDVQSSQSYPHSWKRCAHGHPVGLSRMGWDQ